MLRQRVITALILLPLLLLAVFKLPQLYFFIFVGVVMTLAFWEWMTICCIHKLILRAGLVLALVLSGIVCWLYINPLFVLIAGVSWWMFRFIKLSSTTAPPIQHPLVCLLFGIMFFIPALIATVWLQASSHYAPGVLLGFLLLIWGADIGAYFAGRKYGKTRLAPTISPKKSVEGLLGGLILSAVVGLLLAFILFTLTPLQMLLWAVLVLATVLVSVAGDLVESQFKRQGGVKDSGNLLPGHGGVLDRVDSLIAAVPFFTLSIMLLFN